MERNFAITWWLLLLSITGSKTPHVVWSEDIISSFCMYNYVFLQFFAGYLSSGNWHTLTKKYQIPASFSIQLKRNKSDVVLNNNRRLLNTEKLIFKTNSNQVQYQYEALYSKFLKSLYVLLLCFVLSCYIVDWIQDEFLLVLVTVEPEGFPAKLHVAERQFIIFNIGNVFCLVYW